MFCAVSSYSCAGSGRDPRLEKAIELVRKRRLKDGRWDRIAPPAGALHFPLEAAGAPGRWATLRCLRVLRWWDLEVEGY